ncbi:MAG: hypothetical protein QM715_07355 [Nibricoccus sp.]
MPPRPLFPGAEGLGVRRLTIAILACLFAVWAGVTMADSPYLVFAGFAGLLYVGTLAINAKALAWLVIALQPAALIVPFFPGRPFWWELCALLAWPSLLVYFLVNRQKLSDLKFDRLERRALIAMIGFVAVLIMLMLFRGVGFRVLGGQQMGGRFYTQQMVLAIVPLLLIIANLKERQVVGAVYLGWVMSLTYLVSDFSFSLSGGMQRILYFFEIPTDAINFELGYEVTGLRRYQSFWYVGTAIMSAVLAWRPLYVLLGRGVWFGVPLMVGSASLALSSGHRTVFVQTVTTIVFLSIFQRYWNSARLIVAGLCLVAGLGVLYATAEYMPLSMQRAISFLPGISVDPLSRDNAADTLNDRIEVLKLAVNDIPKYALVGRGFGMERFDVLPSDAAYSGIWQQYINGYFYNGLLGSILKTGIIGFICTGSFVFFVSKMAIDVVRMVRIKNQLEWNTFDRVCLLICAQWFSVVLFHYCLHGDAGVWAQIFALPAALIMYMRRDFHRKTMAATQVVPTNGEMPQRERH